MSDKNNAASQSEAIPAATVVIFRNGPDGQAPEILMTVRSRNMAFAGGMAVFPGGRVDQADFDLAEKMGAEDVAETAHQIAAARETLEETGLAIGLQGDVDAQSATKARKILHDGQPLSAVLEFFGWALDLSAFTPFARWHPKNERIPRVYDTRFYIANLGTGAVEIEADYSENTRLFWTSAKDALAAAEKEDITIIFPTRRNLERLAEFSDFAQAKRQCADIPVRSVIPFMEERDGQMMLCIDDDLGYPVTSEPLTSVQRA